MALKTKHKELIVRELACFTAPKQVQQKMKEQFGIEVSYPAISYYDPDNGSSVRLAKKWRHLFYDTRQKYIEEITAVPIANKGYRMNELQRAFDTAKRKGNLVLALQILEQAAKESGGMYERNASGSGRDDGESYYQKVNQIIINQQNNGK